MFPRQVQTNQLSVLAALIISSLLASPAHAYFSTIDTADLIAPGKYQVSAEPQLVFDRYPGLNAVLRFDSPIDDASQARALIGFGRVDFQVGGFYKYVPYPDTARQPAIGGEVGVIIAHVNGGSETSFRFHPLVSKKLETEIGDIIPYGSLPFGLTTRSDGTFVPIQIVGGAELRPLNNSNISYFAELGINVAQSFSYLSGSVAWRFDESKLFERRE